MRGPRRVLLLAASLLSLGVVFVPADMASAHPPQRSPGPCPGTHVGTYNLNYGGERIGELVIYWHAGDGYNCARMNHLGDTYGVTRTTGVEIVSCERTTPGPCDVVWDDGGRDVGPYGYYAGRVFVNARNRCIYAVGFINWAGADRRVSTGGARHCG